MAARRQLDIFSGGNQTETLLIDNIRRDGGTQSRAAMNQETVERYSADMQAGAIFPPVVVYYDGSDYWLGDGFHRTEARAQAGFGDISAEIRQGTRRDAILHSAGANADHGLPRSKEDKRRAVVALLEDEEWVKWSSREIGRRTKTTHVFVEKIRKELESTGHISSSDERVYEREGEKRTMKAAKVGYASKATPYDPDNPLHVKALRQLVESRLHAEIENGATNEQIKGRLGHTLGLGGGYTEHDVNGVAYKGGASPGVWFGVASSIGKPSIGGMKLIHTVRELLNIPQPKAKPIAQFDAVLTRVRSDFEQRMEGNIANAEILLDGGKAGLFTLTKLAQWAAEDLKAIVSDALYSAALRQLVDEVDEEESADLAFDPTNRDHIFDLLKNDEPLRRRMQLCQLRVVSGKFSNFMSFNDETIGRWEIDYPNSGKVQFWSTTDTNRPTFAFTFDDICANDWLTQFKVESALSQAASTISPDLVQRIALVESWKESPTTELVSLLPYPFTLSVFRAAIGAVLVSIRERQAKLAEMLAQEHQTELPIDAPQPTPPDVKSEPNEHPAHLYQFTNALTGDGDNCVEVRKWRVVKTTNDPINGWIHDIACDDETTAVYADRVDMDSTYSPYFSSVDKAAKHFMRQCDLKIQAQMSLQRMYERAGQVEFSPKEIGMKLAQ